MTRWTRRTRCACVTAAPTGRASSGSSGTSGARAGRGSNRGRPRSPRCAMTSRAIPSPDSPPRRVRRWAASRPPTSLHPPRPAGSRGPSASSPPTEHAPDRAGRADSYAARAVPGGTPGGGLASHRGGRTLVAIRAAGGRATAEQGQIVPHASAGPARGPCGAAWRPHEQRGWSIDALTRRRRRHVIYRVADEHNRAAPPADLRASHPSGTRRPTSRRAPSSRRSGCRTPRPSTSSPRSCAIPASTAGGCPSRASCSPASCPPATVSS